MRGYQTKLQPRMHDIRGSSEWITSTTMLLTDVACDHAHPEQVLVWRNLLHDSIFAIYLAIASHSQICGTQSASKDSCTTSRTSLNITMTLDASVSYSFACKPFQWWTMMNWHLHVLSSHVSSVFTDSDANWALKNQEGSKRLPLCLPLNARLHT